MPPDTLALGIRDLAFVTHAHRELTQLNHEQIVGLLRGEIRNWRQLGGVDAPIRLILSNDAEDAEALQRAIGADLPWDGNGRDSYCGDSRGLRLASRDPFAIVLTARASAERAILEGSALQVVNTDATAGGVANTAHGLARMLCLRIAHMDDSRSEALVHYFASAEGQQALIAAGYAPICAER